MKTIYQIPQAAVTTLAGRVANINKTANKLGVVEVKMTVGDNIIMKRMTDDQGVPCMVPFVNVEIEKGFIGITGYTVIGRVDFLNDSAIVKAIQGEEVPAWVRDIKNTRCDHCNHRRQRNTLILLKDQAEGTIKVVGSTCLNDFVGHQLAIWSVGALFSIETEIEDILKEPGVSRKNAIYPLDSFMAYVVQEVNQYGYTSKTMAEEKGCASTADILANQFFGNGVKDTPTKDHRETASKVIAYFASLKDSEVNNDYLHNLRAIAMNGGFKFSMIGYAASMYSAYLRATTKKQQKQQSNFVGEVGKRIVIKNLRVANVFVFDGMYGASYLLIMVDTDGNQYKTSTARHIANVGDVIEAAKATIKAHEEYNGVNQTVVTRITIL